MTPGLVIKDGPRIRIRQLREDDISHWAYDQAVFSQEFEKPDGPPGGMGKQFAVETKQDEWIGFTGFGAEPGGDAGGYFFIAEPFRGQGYGTELVQCVLQVMFQDCGAARCVIDYHDWNEVAARLYAKIGFEETQRIRIPEDKLTGEDREMAPGREVYAVVISLTREKWESATAASPGAQREGKPNGNCAI